MGPARFERWPTQKKHRELMVGQCGETPLVPPYSLLNLNLDAAGVAGIGAALGETPVELRAGWPCLSGMDKIGCATSKMR